MRRLLLIIPGLVLGVLFVELFLRLFPSYKFEAMVSWSAKIDSEYHSKCYRQSKLFGYELIPNVAEYINSFGMHDKEYTLKKPEGVFRILLLGDSITESFRWHRIVEKKLNKIGKYEILNCGVNAWGISNYYRYLKYKGINFEPDLVLIGFCLNDMDTSVSTIFVNRKEKNVLLFRIKNKGGNEDNELTLKINPGLFKNSYLYRFLIVKCLNKNNRKEKSENREEVEMLKQIKDMSKGKVLGIVFPYLIPLKEYNKNEKYEYKEILSALNKVGIDYLDLHEYFNKYDKEQILNFRQHHSDKIHFNREANIIKGDIIYDWLKEKLEEYID